MPAPRRAPSLHADARVHHRENAAADAAPAGFARAAGRLLSPHAQVRRRALLRLHFFAVRPRVWTPHCHR
jgi:hypothetical protein